ncbi:sugar phosphate isomerase/epimerase [Oceanispirochaeta sp.]|jgi:L-ribulose-5-phosphate 3-epimerase|uniref:sugar phosphate isomerase/epimerase family protein n=1 Tax=Oceanispirochaeta sp. TaxID=2035350 RepID=UPI002612D337|nr:sugar phosphate isomerase/epimerase family protein [Oceanispirochaeta sp.]MDA3959096.1 sugar phosphate isomerase/epimerase [Oceanispirochaeta sp.]
MIGARGHDIAAMCAGKLAEAMKTRGFSAVQLVPYRGIPGIGDAPGQITPALARGIRQEFESRGIHIALMGCYFNMLEPEGPCLRANVERFSEYLRYAADFGCRLVGTETGSYNKDMSFHPDNHGEKAYQRVLKIFRELLPEAQNHGSIIAIEGLYNYAISTPPRLKRLLDDLDSSNVQVIFDPVNLLHERNALNSRELVQEAFDLFGDRILVIHAKDFILEDGKIRTVPLGEGLLNYDHLLTLASEHKPYIDVIIEDLRGDELDRSRRFLEEKMKAVGMPVLY